jgi:hypothetical protein
MIKYLYELLFAMAILIVIGVAPLTLACYFFNFAGIPIYLCGLLVAAVIIDIIY